MTKIIVKKVYEPAVTKDYEEFGLKEMQDIVGGCIECLHVGNGVDMWLNDEGKLIPLPLNLVLGSTDMEILDTIQGDIFFASSDSVGNTIGLTDGQVDWVHKQLDSGDFALAHTQDGVEFVPIWIFAPFGS